MPKNQANSASGSFVMLPVELLTSNRCSPVALKLYAVLLMYCREGHTCFPSHARLAADMHVSERHIRTVLAELIRCRLVTKEERPGTSCLYHVEKYRLAGAQEAAPRTPESTPERNNESSEVHAVESNKNNHFDSKQKRPGFYPNRTAPHLRPNPVDFSKFEPGGKYYRLVRGPGGQELRV